MTVLEKIYWLTDKYEGVGIPYTVIARFAQCSPSAISRYISGEREISDKAEILLKRGIKELKRVLNEKIDDDD